MPESQTIETSAEPSAWEAAYRRFESPAEEVRKFRQRLRWFGAENWPREYRIVDLFCGRGNGLVALSQLGFGHLEGIDLSQTLLAQYQGRAKVYQADCRRLPLPSASRDVVTIHGGLHHLEQIPSDLATVLGEIHRVLRPGGLLAVVEPWLTPFLRLVHTACSVQALRSVWPKLDALAVMIEHERTTYEAWLGKPDVVQQAFCAQFEPLQLRRRLGKVWFLGRKRA